MTLPALLRVVFLGCLAAVAVMVMRSPSTDARGVFELRQARPSVVADAILSRVPPARIRWSAPTPPDAHDLWLLKPGPLVPPLTVPVGAVAGLSVVPPTRPTAGRNAAIGVRMNGRPGDSTAVFVSDALGAVDSMLMRFDADGRAEAGVRVQAGGAGWQSWTLRSGADSIRVGAWVREERSLNVLVLSGTPDWESRYALRALEESGVRVDARFDLGRRSIGGGQPSDLEAFLVFDVVMLMGEVALGAAAADGLRTFVASGGGVLVAPSIGSALPTTGTTLAALLRGWGVADSLQVGFLESGSTPLWTLPPELSPLSAAPARVRTLTGVGPSAYAGAKDASGRMVVALGAIGRGRVAFSGIGETWRWRMEAGDVEGHRLWWRDWVQWAAGGLRETMTVTVPTSELPVGSRVDVTVATVDSEAQLLPATVELVRPDGGVESLPVAQYAPDRMEPVSQTGSAHFVAATPGAYQIRAPGAETGVLAIDRGPAASPADRSLAAIRSGRLGESGEPVPGEAISERGLGSLPSGDDTVMWTPAGGPFLPLWLGAFGALLLAIEWTIRRKSGGP